MRKTPRILAIGGGSFVTEKGPTPLERFLLSLTGKRKPRVCFLSTATGEPVERIKAFYKAFGKVDCEPSHVSFFRGPMPREIPLVRLEKGLLAQDAIYVGGGNTHSMVGVWRAWGVDSILRKAWQRGIVLGGWSAGALCWFDAAATDSLLGPGRSSAMRFLGFLPGSCSPHFDGEPRRRPEYRKLILRGELPPGIGIDNHVGVLFEGRKLATAVSSKAGATAYRAKREAKTVRFEPLQPQQIAE